MATEGTQEGAERAQGGGLDRDERADLTAPGEVGDSMAGLVRCPECEGRGRVMGFAGSHDAPGSPRSPGSAGRKAVACPLCGGEGQVTEGTAARRLAEDAAARAAAKRQQGPKEAGGGGGEDALGGG